MPDFAAELTKYLDKLDNLRKRGASEDSIRDACLQFLRAVFPRLEQAEPILLERHIPALRVRGGYADALYGDLIFEFKRTLTQARRAEGREEIERYIANQRHPKRYLGILTDGQQLEVYALEENQLAPVDTLTLNPQRAEEAKLWLDCYLFHEKNLVPTADDVALRFGERSPTFWRSQRVLGRLWSAVASLPGPQTKFLEWQSLLSIVYGSTVGDEPLFLRHTYLALLARALAFVALERRAPSGDELPGIIDGDTFRRMGLEDFVGRDFFTWLVEPAIFVEAQDLLRGIATRLTVAYDLGAIREDLLKELYQELVDPQTRHDLGEFYTPDWLAELTLRKAGFPPQETGDLNAFSLLDPACGSGTFLFTAVRLARESGCQATRLVEYCCRHLAGVDVHPLAVTIAKTNLLLALGDDLRGYRRAVTLPVFLADSLSAEKPKLKPDPHLDVIRIPVDADRISQRARKKRPPSLPPVFEIPVVLADNPHQLHQCLDGLLEFSDPELSESDAWEGFGTRLEQLRIAERTRHFWARNLRLMRWLLEPPATDSVWRFILQNAFQPELLARRKFAFVVGNPPWLSYRYIQRRDYQQRVRQLVFDYDLLERRRAHLFTQMELATLFFVYCADRYLAEGGTLAFVMPRSVLTGAKQHGAFQQEYVACARLLIDCEQVTPLFQVPACSIVWEKAVPARSRGRLVPVLHLKGGLPSRNVSLAQAEQTLHTSESKYKPLSVEPASPYWSEVTQGASLAPRCVWFVRPPESAWTIDRRRPQLETDRTTERQAKTPWKGIRLSGSVEGDFLFATLLSDNMLPFGRRQLSLIVAPIVQAEHRYPLLLDVQGATRRGKAGLAKWLRSAENVWIEHRKSAASLLDWIDWQKKLTRQRPKGVLKVLYNASGTHLCSCIVDATDTASWEVHHLPVQGFVADSVTYWFDTASADEAHYLCAVLNAPYVDEAIKPYQTKGAFGAQRGGGHRHIHRRPFEVLPIPRFDSKDKHHRRLAALSRRCHKKVRQTVQQARTSGDQKFFTRPIGRLRTQLRQEVLRAELDEINELVEAVLRGDQPQ